MPLNKENEIIYLLVFNPTETTKPIYSCIFYSLEFVNSAVNNCSNAIGLFQS